MSSIRFFAAAVLTCIAVGSIGAGAATRQTPGVIPVGYQPPPPPPDEPLGYRGRRSITIAVRVLPRYPSRDSDHVRLEAYVQEPGKERVLIGEAEPNTIRYRHEPGVEPGFYTKPTTFTTELPGEFVIHAWGLNEHNQRRDIEERY